MRDFKYQELLRAYPEWRKAMKELEEIKSVCLRPCAAVFVANLRRTIDFAAMPAELITRTRLLSLLHSNAIFRATGKGAVTMQESMELVHDDAVTVASAAHPPTPEDIQCAKFFGVFEAAGWTDGNAGMQASMDALYTSMILESWLFFEAMAADLWVSAVDNSKGAILGRVMGNKEWEKDKAEIRAPDVPSMLANPKTHPGSYYRELGMVSFQRLRSIHRYYTTAFESNVSKLLDTTDGGYVNALNIVRNCIIHSAGRVDPSFVKSAQRFDELRGLKVGDKIELDGVLVRRLTNSAAFTGLAILQAVDEMLLRGD